MLTRSKRRRLEEEEDPVIVSSHYELEREAKIKRAKVELMSLKVVDLRRELGTFGLPKTDLVDRLALHKLVPRPFDSLPDEVLLKIVRMASWKRSEITICRNDLRWFSGSSSEIDTHTHTSPLHPSVNNGSSFQTSGQTLLSATPKPPINLPQAKGLAWCIVPYFSLSLFSETKTKAFVRKRVVVKLM